MCMKRDFFWQNLHTFWYRLLVHYNFVTTAANQRSNVVFSGSSLCFLRSRPFPVSCPSIYPQMPRLQRPSYFCKQTNKQTEQKKIARPRKRHTQLAKSTKNQRDALKFFLVSCVKYCSDFFPVKTCLVSVFFRLAISIFVCCHLTYSRSLATFCGETDLKASRPRKIGFWPFLGGGTFFFTAFWSNSESRRDQNKSRK